MHGYFTAFFVGLATALYYGHNYLTWFALRFSPFETAYGYQPPLFLIQIKHHLSNHSSKEILVLGESEEPLLKGKTRAAQYANKMFTCF